jgi:hypothetical protein
MLGDESPGTGCAILAHAYALWVEQQPGSTEEHLAWIMVVSHRGMPEVFRIARRERETIAALQVELDLLRILIGQSAADLMLCSPAVPLALSRATGGTLTPIRRAIRL